MQDQGALLLPALLILLACRKADAHAAMMSVHALNIQHGMCS